MKYLKKKMSFLLVMLLLLNTISPLYTLPVEAAGETGTIQDLPHRAPSAAYTIYVAPNGNDTTGTGTSAQPFQSLKKARDKVRELPKTGDIVVEFADGFYPMGEKVMLDDRDSGNSNSTIYYQAAQGAKPLLSGGFKLSGTWTSAESDITWEHTGTAYKIPLTRDKKLRSIYVNGKRAKMTKCDHSE